MRRQGKRKGVTQRDDSRRDRLGGVGAAVWSAVVDHYQHAVACDKIRHLTTNTHREESTRRLRKESAVQARNGALQAFTFFRRRLLQGGELSPDERGGLIDLLNATEEHMVGMWEFVEVNEKVTHKWLTRAASAKITRGRRV